jgi:hypothetical protein
MNELDPFVLWLLVGAILGFARIAPQILQASAVVAVAAMAWVFVVRGSNALQAPFVTAVPQFLVLHAHAAGGVALGLILGASLGRIVRPGGTSTV